MPRPKLAHPKTKVQLYVHPLVMEAARRVAVAADPPKTTTAVLNDMLAVGASIVFGDRGHPRFPGQPKEAS